MTVKRWSDIAQSKRELVKHAIPSEWINDSIKDEMALAGYINTKAYLDTIVPKNELDITELTMLELQSKIAGGKLSALEVTTAYCHRTALAQQILNCCSEIFFDKALEKASELDDYYKKNGEVIGPLHGIPISLKDQVDLPGFDSSIGYIAYVNKPKEEISLLAEFLQNAGAVFYVKTTVPMAMMAPETVSNIFGYTHNAININLTSGGSSGGEGALIGAGASPMGFGTDIGGSIRIPSAFQGLHALKPSTGRISYLGVSNSYASQETMPSAIGPMARSLDDVSYMTKLIIEGELWNHDPKVMPIPYSDKSSLKLSKLTFGVWKYDGLIHPHPPIKRALEETIKALKLQGHEVIEVSLPNNEETLAAADDIFRADQGVEIVETCGISGEPVVPEVGNIVVNKESDIPLSVNEWWSVCAKHYKLKQKFVNFWNETAKSTGTGKPIDGLIGPVWPSCSFSRGVEPTLNYSCPFNFFDAPSVVIPVTKADKDIDVVEASSTDDSFAKTYDPKLFDGMPVCLQVVGRQLQEETTLAMASVVESSLRG